MLAFRAGSQVIPDALDMGLQCRAYQPRTVPSPCANSISCGGSPCESAERCWPSEQSLTRASPKPVTQQVRVQRVLQSYLFDLLSSSTVHVFFRKLNPDRFAQIVVSELQLHYRTQADTK
jgi:hypothetical protein